MSGDQSKSQETDTAAIDDGWGDEDESVGLPARREPDKTQEASPRAKPAAKPLPPPPVPPPAEVAKAAAAAADDFDDDHIDFDDPSSISRDSIPTFQHPNPLMFDRPDSAQPTIPKPPLLPKKSGKR